MDTKITTLYPLVGGICIFCSFGYILLEKTIPKSFFNVSKSEEKKSTTEETTNTNWLFLVPMITFFFLDVGSNCIYFHYLASYCVLGPLALSSKDASQISAYFNGAFATSLFLCIFLAMKLKPLLVILFSFSICILSISALILYGTTNISILTVGATILAAGFAPIFPTGKQYQLMIIAL